MQSRCNKVTVSHGVELEVHLPGAFLTRLRLIPFMSGLATLSLCTLSKSHSTPLFLCTGDTDIGKEVEGGFSCLRGSTCLPSPSLEWRCRVIGKELASRRELARTNWRERNQSRPGPDSEQKLLTY